MIKLKSLIEEENDYDPAWDYNIHKNPPRKLIKIVDNIIKSNSIIKLLQILKLNSPRISYIKDNKKEALARYITGTANFPHIVIDMDTIQAAVKADPSNIGYAIESTIVHELIHAYLETRGLDPSEHDEDAVEGATQEYMDFRDPADIIHSLRISYPYL
jgi:hypothetical protein